MADMRRIREIDRRNTCLHEAAHSVVRQLKMGNLSEVGVERRGTSYSYPLERRPFDQLERPELADVAVVVAAGIVAEFTWCRRIGDQDHVVSDDRAQWEGIRRLGGFSDGEMDALYEEAGALLRAHERAVRRVALELDRRRKLTGKQVSRLMEAAGSRRDADEE